VAAYVADLRAARDRRAEQVAKPFSDDDVRRMSDEVETAEEVAEALYERRVGKVVKLASFAAADMPVDADGMTTEERQLFDDLVDRISENKSRVLDVLAGEAPPASTDAVPTDDATPLGDATNAPRRRTRAPPQTRPRPRRIRAPGRNAVWRRRRSPGTGESADALAGAMGSSDDEVADALDATTDVTTDGESRATDGSPADGNATADDASAGDGPTPVPPEPAPPGNTGHGRERRPSRERRRSDRRHCRRRRLLRPRHGQDHPRRGGDIRSRRAGVRPRKRDVVTLPAENADPLVQRDAAERLD